jgi:hypothetical protein
MYKTMNFPQNKEISVLILSEKSKVHV